MKFKGIYSTELIGCIYCDKCGSFKIGRRLTGANFYTLLITGFILFAIWDKSRDLFQLIIAIIFGTLIFGLFLKPLGIMELGYRCRKCKNKEISFFNVLGFKEYDQSVLDIAFWRTKKLYKWDY